MFHAKDLISGQPHYVVGFVCGLLFLAIVARAWWRTRSARRLLPGSAAHPAATSGRSTAVLLTTLGLLGVTFLGAVLWQTWHWTQQHIAATADQQTRLAIEFDNALRGYVAKYVRPEMEKRIRSG